MPDLPPPLAETLETVAAMMAGAADPWWLIGSAAMALHGAAPITVRDVDVLLSVADADRLIAAHGLSPLSEPGRFRSTRFARIETAPLPIELMAALEVRQGEGWAPVRPATRQTVRLGEALLYLPSIAEMRDIGRLFGRPKDLERDALLAALLAWAEGTNP